MASTAAATRPLHASRRRTHGPAAGERVGALSGVIGATALVVAAWILASTPSVNATPAKVRHHLGSHYTLTPGEPVAAAAAWLLVALWVIALARTIGRGDPTTLSEENHEPR